MWALYRPIACDVTFGHFRIRPFGRCAMLRDAGGQKCIAVIIDKVTRRDWQWKLMTSQLSIDLYTLPVALCFASVFRLAKWQLLIVASGFSFTIQYANTS